MLLHELVRTQLARRNSSRVRGLPPTFVPEIPVAEARKLPPFPVRPCFKSRYPNAPTPGSAMPEIPVAAPEPNLFGVCPKSRYERAPNPGTIPSPARLVASAAYARNPGSGRRTSSHRSACPRDGAPSPLAWRARAAGGRRRRDMEHTSAGLTHFHHLAALAEAVIVKDRRVLRCSGVPEVSTATGRSFDLGSSGVPGISLLADLAPLSSGAPVRRRTRGRDGAPLRAS